jgi:hypothetical protein
VIIPMRWHPLHAACRSPRRIGAEFIGEKEGANRPFIDSDEHHHGRTPRAAA